jgi:hypothetical protein
LIQATLLYAVNNENLPIASTDPALAEAYIFSRSILPYIDEVDSTAAATISKNLNFQFTAKPVIDGHKAIFNAFNDAISKTNSIDCKNIGYLDSNGGVCPGSVKAASSSASTQSFSFWMISGAMASFLWVVF